jgi:hypothetical protein
LLNLIKPISRLDLLVSHLADGKINTGEIFLIHGRQHKTQLKQMNSKTISAISFTAILLSPAIAQANSITADSKAWTNDGLTLEVGASQRQFEVSGIKPVHKVREVHVPAIEAYCYINAHGQEIYVPRVEGYTYHENYTVYENFTKQVGKASANAKVTGRLGNDVLLGVGYDSHLYATGGIRNGSLVASTGLNTSGSYFGTLAYSPIKNLAVIAHAQKEFTAYGLQTQLGNTSFQVAYAPSVKGWSFGVGQEIGSKSEPTFNLQPVPEMVKALVPVKSPAIVKVPVKSPAIVKSPAKKVPANSQYIRGRG